MAKALKVVLIAAAIVALFWVGVMLIVSNQPASWNKLPEIRGV